jgi:hypothetical protein
MVAVPHRLQAEIILGSVGYFNGYLPEFSSSDGC